MLRRTFLRRGLAVVGGSAILVMAGCGEKPRTIEPTAISTPPPGGLQITGGGAAKAPAKGAPRGGAKQATD
jgi:hypothetical protein